MTVKKILFKMILLVVFVAILGAFFAKVEIQIEGDQGWAKGLPTWRIEKHWMLDVFWGGRAMTGYHAWIFSFMFLVFHIPIFISGSINFQLEIRILGSLMFFWLIEDFLWFIFNPAYGFAKFLPIHIPWHKHWFLSMPFDYWLFFILGSFLLLYSFRREYINKKKSEAVKQDSSD